MDFLDQSLHLLNFAAPAFGMALGLVLITRLLGLGGPRQGAWWGQWLLNGGLGVAVLAGGLWYFGRDGKLPSYVAMTLVMASSQWLLVRGWRD